MKLARAIAYSGLTSRRGAERLIKEKVVKVNGKIITDLSSEVDLNNDSVTVNNKVLPKPPGYVYIIVYKPTNCMTTTKDEKGRETVLDLLKPRHRKGKIFPVGRLDYKSEGLLLLTNDGELTNLLIHPKNEIPKKYSIKIQS